MLIILCILNVESFLGLFETFGYGNSIVKQDEIPSRFFQIRVLTNKGLSGRNSETSKPSFPALTRIAISSQNCSSS